MSATSVCTRTANNSCDSRYRGGVIVTDVNPRSLRSLPVSRPRGDPVESWGQEWVSRITEGHPPPSAQHCGEGTACTSVTSGLEQRRVTVSPGPNSGPAPLSSSQLGADSGLQRLSFHFPILATFLLSQWNDSSPGSTSDHP